MKDNDLRSENTSEPYHLRNISRLQSRERDAQCPEDSWGWVDATKNRETKAGSAHRIVLWRAHEKKELHRQDSRDVQRDPRGSEQGADQCWVGGNYPRPGKEPPYRTGGNEPKKFGRATNSAYSGARLEKLIILGALRQVPRRVLPR